MSINSTVTIQDLPTALPHKTGWVWTEPKSSPNTIVDSSQYPRISIVTPSYNYGQFIEETIRSVLLQGYPNLEYIIIDGGSTDNTVEIIKKYEQFLTYWVSEPDEGQTDAINKGYQHCTGDIFVWLNADDAYANPNCLHEVSQLYQQGYQLIVGECLNVDEQDRPIQITKEFNGYTPPQNFDQYLRFWSFVPLPQPAVFIAKEFCDKSFPLDTGLYGTMDYQLFLRVLGQNPKSIWVKQTWVKFKYHGQNKTMQSGEIPYLEHYQISLSEAQKSYNLWQKIAFQISAKDFFIIAYKMHTQASFLDLFVTLLSRPTLSRWSLFWKVLLKALMGKNNYLKIKRVMKLSSQV